MDVAPPEAAALPPGIPAAIPFPLDAFGNPDPSQIVPGQVYLTADGQRVSYNAPGVKQEPPWQRTAIARVLASSRKMASITDLALELAGGTNPILVFWLRTVLLAAGVPVPVGSVVSDLAGWAQFQWVAAPAALKPVPVAGDIWVGKHPDRPGGFVARMPKEPGKFTASMPGSDNLDVDVGEVDFWLCGFG